jgi:Leucine-rich repeat (LRR) protein
LSGNLLDDLTNVGTESLVNLKDLCVNHNRLVELPSLENYRHLVKLWVRMSQEDFVLSVALTDLANHVLVWFGFVSWFVAWK